jgi:imidazoleglycerol-phosphate dehydratase
MNTTLTRQAKHQRQTKETQIEIVLQLDDPTLVKIETGLPFFDHMLTAMATHGRFGLQIQARGDIEVDPHHLIEDVGITLGQTLKLALHDYTGIWRAGHFAFAMDGTLSHVALDLCGRANLVWNVKFGPFTLGGIDPNLFREFYKGFADGAALTLHAHVLCQDNDHHVIESIFKATGRALYTACCPIASDQALSTKGTLSL